MADLQMVSYKLEDLQFFNKLEKPGQIQLIGQGLNAHHRPAGGQNDGNSSQGRLL